MPKNTSSDLQNQFANKAQAWSARFSEPVDERVFNPLFTTKSGGTANVRRIPAGGGTSIALTSDGKGLGNVHFR